MVSRSIFDEVYLFILFYITMAFYYIEEKEISRYVNFGIFLSVKEM